MKVSRVELEDGQVVTVEHPEDWKSYKIEAFARLNAPSAKKTESSGATDNKEDDISTADLAKLGLSRFAVQFVPDVFLYSKEERARELNNALQGQGVENAALVNERMARRMAGVPEQAQLSTRQEVVAALSDPTALAAGPGRAAGNVAKQLMQQSTGKLVGPVATNLAETGAKEFLKRTLQAAPSSVLSTTGGVVGSEVATEAAADSGIGPMGQEIAGVFGGASLGVSLGGVSAPAVNTAAKVLKDLKGKVTGGGETFNVASEAMANSMVKAEIARINQSTRPEEVAQAVESLVSLKEEIPELGISGIVATLSENPVARNWIRKTTQNNKIFQKQLFDTIKKDAGKLASKFDEVLGADEEVTRTLIENVMERQFNRLETQARDRVDRQNLNIEKALDNLAVRLTGKKDEVQVGNVANKLLDRKEAIIRKEASDLYKVAENIGKQLSLPEESVASVYSQFKNVRLDDVFGPGSRTATLLEKRWSPKEIKDEQGNISIELPEVTGLDLISLKKAVNSEISGLSRIRDRNSEQSQRLNRLYSLKDIVRQNIEDQGSLSPDFVNQLKKADAFYYKELGLPLSAEGMRQFSSRKFDREAAQTLMDYEKAKDYVNFVGPNGMAVVRHAVRLKAEKAGVVDAGGQINQKKLDQFIRRNDRLISYAGLDSEFSDISGRLKTITGTQARHNDAYKEKSRELANGLFKAVSQKTLPAVVSEMVSSPAKRKYYLSEVNKLNDQEKNIVLTGLRQEFLSQAALSKGTMVDYINRNAEAVNDVFDKNYVRNVNKLAELKDLMDKVSSLLVDSLGATPVVDTLQQKTGFGIAELSGTLRNQVLSAERKAINLTMKSITSKGQEKFYNKSAEVLVDPDVVAKLANPPKEGLENFVKDSLKGTGDYLRSVGTFYVDTLNETLGLSAYKAINASEGSIDE